MYATGKKKEEGMGEKELLREINDKLGRLIDWNEERAREEARARKLIDPPRWMEEQQNRSGVPSSPEALRPSAPCTVPVHEQSKE